MLFFPKGAYAGTAFAVLLELIWFPTYYKFIPPYDGPAIVLRRW
jgi:hypothetical protein